ncbi:MAG: hypothetical protein GTO71_10360 [Woeseiaceae bacterium]|nr:hypothetical protein [Woeseiaceae bacterium]NIP21475.1 hypothetical protein [Woeseiaceae bacterium]NIS90463.1 hypothetical protein [Woeseiaceae bacterium]
MAEKLRDAEDRWLESMFAAEPIADDGFSRRVVGRIRRRIWIRRLALPVAMLVGGVIALKPASQLLLAVSKLLTVVPQDVVVAPAEWLPQMQGVAISGSIMQTAIYGAVLLGVGLLGAKMLTE